MISKMTRILLLLTIPTGLLTAAEPPAIWELINRESDVAEIVYECNAISGDAKHREELLKLAKSRGLNLVSLSKPLVFRTVKAGEFYTTEHFGSVGGDPLWAQGINNEGAWRLERSTLKTIGPNVEPKDNEGKVLKSVIGEIAGDIRFHNAVKFGIPILPASGKWDGQEFSGQGPGGRITSGRFGYTDKGELALAQYALINGADRLNVTVRYSDLEGGVPKNFTIERAGDISVILPEHESYRILKLDRGPAKPSSLDPYSVVNKDKIELEIKHGEDAVTFVSKGNNQVVPHQASLKLKLWWVFAAVIIVTPFFVLHGGARKQKRQK
jgi:hypothetical protein